MAKVHVEVGVIAVCHPGRTIFIVELKTPDDDMLIEGDNCDAIAGALSGAVQRVLTERCSPKREPMMPRASSEIS